MAQLPPELWHEILGHATFVFGELEERIYDPFCCPPAHELGLAIKGSQSSRYNFIHVSRAFYMLSIPHLYRTILVAGPISWKRFEQGLAFNQRRVCIQPNTLPNTSFIRSIHFLTAWALNGELNGSMISLPNLTICRSTKTNILAYDAEIRHPFCIGIKAPRLRALEGVYHDARTCLHTAAHFPSLTYCTATILHSNPTIRELPYDGSPIRLEATTVGKEWPFHRELHLDPARIRAIKMTEIRPDLSSLYTIGHQIQFLDITSSHWCYRRPAIELSMLPALITLITDIAITGYNWQLLDGQIHKSLKRVGFTVQSRQQRHNVYRSHLRRFDCHRFPALEQIRLLEMPTCRRLVAQNPGRSAIWSSELGSRGVRLEAADGTLLVDLSSAAVCLP